MFKIIMDFTILTIFVSLVGLAIGSFINVIVFRTKTDDPFWKGRSQCRTCEQVIAPKDLIPVISYFSLKGRCRNCSATIEWQYPAVELAMGILFGVLFARAGFAIGLPDWLSEGDWIALFVRDAVLASFLVIIFVYDFKYSYILDRFSIPAIVVALFFNLYLGAEAFDILLGGLVIGSFFAIQCIFSNGKWVGGGDIRMGMLMGIILGLSHGVVALFLSYIAGAVVGIILIATKKKELSSQVPFGTFMAGATIIVMIFGNQILDWYLGLLG